MTRTNTKLPWRVRGKFVYLRGFSFYRIDVELTLSDMDILERLTSKTKQLDALRPLPEAALGRLRQDLAVEMTYNSNAIEGNTITLKQTRMVLEHGVTVSGKSLREHFEITNHREAIDVVEDIARSRRPLTDGEILQVHAIVLQNIEKEFAGRYRTGQVRILGANFIPPNYLKVPDLVREALAETNNSRNWKNDVVRAARFHHRFVWIHPFFDGNGRTARLLMNLLLMRRGYPPAIILFNDRARYYRALEQANGGNYQSFDLLVSQAVERSLDLYLEAAGAFGEDEYVPLSQLVAGSPYSQEYLSLLARHGKIDAHKKGRNWLSTRTAIENYRKAQERLSFR
jgi:Fic family protein